MTNLRKSAILGAASLTAIMMASAQGAFAQTNNTGTIPSTAEMWRILQAQQAKIDALETELAKAQVETIETKKSVEVIADAVETTSGASAGIFGADTQIGGYGELHYEGGAKDQIDFHRFVLFVAHDFTDNIRFFSELEVEHAISGDGQVGEVELEQAYVEFDLNDSTQAFAGVRLVPVGLLNETHEPPTFYGVERNAVEKNIIPTTWWEGGIGVSGNIGDTGFSYDTMVSSGLELNAANGYKVRSGRQKIGKANFKNQAFSGRLGYTGLPGVSLASSLYYQSDVTQKVGDSQTGDAVSALLFTASADAKWNGFGLRALYAGWNLDGADVDAIGRDKQNGFYLEPSYQFDLPFSGIFEDSKLGVFYRYADWDNNAGLDNNTGTHRNVFGVNYWPIDDIVFKLDYIIEDKDSGGPSAKSMNLGVGYQF